VSELTIKNVLQEDYRHWDEFVMDSNQGSIFATSRYFTLVDRRFHLYWVTQGNSSIKAGVLLPVTSDGKHVELDDFIIYSGIFFKKDVHRVLSKKRQDNFQLTEFVIDKVLTRYSSVNLSLTPQYEDMRPFLWFGYNDPKINKFNLDLRYTSYVNISELATDDIPEDDLLLFKDLEPVRRYGVREARRKLASIEFGKFGDQLIAFYIAMMSKQGVDVSSNYISNMTRVIDGLCGSGLGIVAQVMNASGEILYMVMYAWDNKRAYYLYGAGNPVISESWQGSFIHWEVFKYLAKVMKIKEVDLEGVNSPQRGWFKLGFGGNLKSYYQVTRL